MSGTDVQAVAARFAGLDATLAAVGPRLAQAAPSGEFDQVLGQVDAALRALDPEAAGEAPGATTGAAAGAAMGADVGPADTQLTAAGYPAGGTGPAATGAQVVDDARRYLGVPYLWGGSTPESGFDCSGLVQRVYADLGVDLPRTSQQQAGAGTAVASLADARPGDLVFFEPGPDGPGHVGIYTGNGQMIAAPHTGTVVQVQPVGTPSAIRRVLTDPAAAAAMPANLGVPAALVPLFTAAGAAHQVSPVLLAALAKRESGFDPHALSRTGAQGIAQFEPDTAAGLGIDPWDPAQAIDGEARLISGYLHDYHGSVALAIAAYNAGPGAVAQYGGVPPYAETQAEISSVTALLNGAAG